MVLAWWAQDLAHVQQLPFWTQGMRRLRTRVTDRSMSGASSRSVILQLREGQKEQRLLYNRRGPYMQLLASRLLASCGLCPWR